MAEQQGRFITVEGQDGAGKTTNLGLIRELLTQAGIDFVETREPGGTELGEQIRSWVLHGAASLNATAELLLIFAARAQHLDAVIKPALARGRWVLCDRFTDATYAYQGSGRGLSLDHIALLEDLVQGDLRPDLTILLDVEVGIGAGRAGERSDPDRFESEDEAFKQAVREGYLRQAQRFPQRFRIVDASRELTVVQQQIRAAISDYLAGVGG